jgi:serine/threonine-protein kinase
MKDTVSSVAVRETGADLLFNRLHQSGVAVDEVITGLRSRVGELKPEDIIAHALKLDSTHAASLIKLLADTRQAPDLSTLSLQPDDIDSPVVKISLLNYLGTVDHPRTPLLVSRFLGDSNKVVLFEALKALKKLSIDFDISMLLPHVESMAGVEQNMALEILSLRADANLVGHLSDYLTLDSSRLNDFFAGILAQHADEKNFEIFLKRLSIDDESKRRGAMACLQKAANENLSKVAKGLIVHDQAFVRDAAQQLVSNLLDEADLARIGQFALSDNPQVRVRAIKSLGKSANRASLSILKKVVNRWPEDSVLVLRAINQLGFSKGLEVAFKCLDSQDAKIQRASLETVEKIITDRHAARARENILWKIPSLAEGLRDYAKSLVIRFTWDYGLPDIQIDENESSSDAMADIPAWIEESRAQAAAEAPLMLRSVLDELEPNSVWMDRYRIKREIGRGAMGRVLLAKDLMVEELVILKFMQPEFVVDEKAIERFKREVKYARRIGHRNVIRVYDLQIRDELCAISMEYFKGRGLESILKEVGAFDVRDGLKILYQICAGMAAAHEQSVIHRDLKPSNVLIGDSGQVKIADFGIASARASSDMTLTQTGSIIGSPAYLAPERVNDQDADERSDIYSLGIIAYYLLGGKLPYQGTTREVLTAHCEGGAKPVSEVNRLVPRKVANLVAHMMAVDPAQRPQSMTAVRKEISALLKSI